MYARHNYEILFENFGVHKEESQEHSGKKCAIYFHSRNKTQDLNFWGKIKQK